MNWCAASDIVGTPLASFADSGDIRQAGSIQRLLRRGIGQCARFGSFARDPGFRTRNSEERKGTGPAAALAGSSSPGRRPMRCVCDDLQPLLPHGAILAAQTRRMLLLKAMKDELERSRTLQISGLDKPYFIEYTVEDVKRIACLRNARRYPLTRTRITFAFRAREYELATTLSTMPIMCTAISEPGR